MNKTTKIALTLAVIGVLTKVVQKIGTYESICYQNNKKDTYNQISIRFRCKDWRKENENN